MSIPTTTNHPLTFEQFDDIYRARLGDADRPTAYVAYVRAEAQVEETYGIRRYKNHQTFMAARTNRRARSASPDEPNRVGESPVGKTPIKCQLCDTELYLVPRGDLRTIIPHFCEGCRDEIKKLILV